MRLNFLDILSDSPKNFIFKKEANKTNFGGFLTIIFLLVFLLFSILYILDYYEKVYTLESPYEIQNLRLQNTTDVTDREKLNSDPNLNPTKTFWIYLSSRSLDGKDSPLSDNFLLFQRSNRMYKLIHKEKNGSYSIRGKLSDITLFLVYNCSDINCTIRPEDQNEYYHYKIYWQVPTLTHQNPSFPVDENKLLFRFITKRFSINYLQYLDFYWEKIIYKEEKTLFNRLVNGETEYKYWDLKEYDIFLEDKKIYEYFKYLLIIESKNDYLSYFYYKRKSITFFDTLAKLASLFQTFYATVFYIYKYYAKNFNNYKIIEKVLQINTKSFKQYEPRNILYKQNNIPAKEFIEIKDKLGYKLIDDDSEDSKTEEVKVNDYPRKNTLIKKISEANDELDEFLQIKIMPKFSFIRFFCNNLYFQNCCYKYRKQEFLHICDEISLKYMSIESILYYQMVLENILKDYKWNQPILYNIETNELLDKLKNI